MIVAPAIALPASSLATPATRIRIDVGTGAHIAQRRDPVLRAAHQLIAVAQRVPDPDSLVTGIGRTRWWRYALPLDAPIRSKPILLAYLRARGVFERHPPELRAAEHRALLRRTLSGGEFAVYLVLAEPSWATRKEVMAAAACARLKRATLHGALCHAPWIEHPCRGCYAIVGSSQRSTDNSSETGSETQPDVGPPSETCRKIALPRPGVRDAL